SLEESTAAFDMAGTVRDLSRIEKFRLFVFTYGLTTVKGGSPEKRDGLQITYHVWDIGRLYRAITSGQQQESIDIDFVRQFGAPLQCLVAPCTWTDYAAHLAIMPGPVLAQIYEEYGIRLLERNVRSFLQMRGKVNKGIKNTILNEPERFLAYNNGISATASSVRLVSL